MPSTSAKQHRWGSMRIPSREELAWIAGIFCGEGSISVHRTRRWTNIRLTVGQAGDSDVAPEMLTRLHDILGAGGIHRVSQQGRGKAHYKAQWQFCIHPFQEVQAAIAMIWSWLTPEKKDQATTAFKTYHAERAVKGTANYALYRRSTSPI